MAIRLKSKKPPRGAGRPKKKGKAGHDKKGPAHAAAAEHKPATVSKSLLAKKPPRKTHGKKPFVRTAPHVEPVKRVVARGPKPPRRFVVAAESAAHPSALRTKKKKGQVVLRFTENTLRDIAALECVRRCFH